MTIYFFLRKIFSKKNLKRKPVIASIIVLCLVNIFYFSTIFFITFKIKGLAKENNINLEYEGISLTGYPFFPSINFNKIIMTDTNKTLNLYINNAKISVNFNKIFFSTQSLQVFRVKNKIQINIPHEIHGEYKIGLQKSFLKIYQNSSEFDYSSDLKTERYSLYSSDIIFEFIKNSLFKKFSVKGFLKVTQSKQNIMELILDFDKIIKFNDKFNIIDIYQINKFKIDAISNAISVNGIFFFQKDRKLPIINIEAIISNYHDLFKKINEKLSSHSDVEFDFAKKIIRFYEQDLFPLLKKNEVKTFDKQSLNIKCETKNNNLLINNLPVQEILTVFNNKFADEKYIKDVLKK